MEIKRVDRPRLSGRTIAGVRFNAPLGFVEVPRVEEDANPYGYLCPFCVSTARPFSLRIDLEYDVGGQVANEQASCVECGFSQSPVDGVLVLPDAWCRENGIQP